MIIFFGSGSDFLSLNLTQYYLWEVYLPKDIFEFKIDYCAKTEEKEEDMLSGDGLHEDNQRSRTSFEVIARRFLSPTQ